MKLTAEYTIEKLAGRDILLPKGQTVLDGGQVFTINAAARWYMEQLKADKTPEALTALAEKHYGAETPAERETIRRDTEAFLNALRRMGLLEE